MKKCICGKKLEEEFKEDYDKKTSFNNDKIVTIYYCSFECLLKDII